MTCTDCGSELARVRSVETPARALFAGPETTKGAGSKSSGLTLDHDRKEEGGISYILIG